MSAETSITILRRNQIGGCVTIISCTQEGKTSRIMIDYGKSLAGGEPDSKLCYDWEGEPVEAVFFTHYHGDHVGRIDEIPGDVPIYMGAVALRIMTNIYEALVQRQDENTEKNRRILARLKDTRMTRVFRKKKYKYEAVTEFAPFEIEPYFVDHSAYDAYMFVITAPDDACEKGRRVILHTGDFRTHGRMGKGLLPTIYVYVRRRNSRKVNDLIIEGTMMSRPGDIVRTEHMLMKEATKYLKEHKYAFLICSSTNLDSLASFYNAAQEAAGDGVRKGTRFLYCYSRYLVTQLNTFTETAGAISPIYRFEHVRKLDPTGEIPGLSWERVYPNGIPADIDTSKPVTQKDLMLRFGFLAVVKPEDFCEEYLEAFRDAPEQPLILYSMWDGYLNPEHPARNDAWIRFFDRWRGAGFAFESLHTSGHAVRSSIESVIIATEPTDGIYPMHTEQPKNFYNLRIPEKYKAIFK